jgi:ketosteroid isomerase-like protein
MSHERAIDNFFELVNQRNLDQLKDHLDENATFYFPKTQPLLGRDRIIRFFNILFRQYPKLEFQVLRKIVQGRMAAVHWKNSGVNKKQEPYENEGVTLLETEAGKITFISDFFKDTGKF